MIINIIGLTLLGIEATHDQLKKEIYKTLLIPLIILLTLSNIIQGQLLSVIFWLPTTLLIGKVLEKHIWHYGDTLYLAAATLLAPHKFLYIWCAISATTLYIYIRKKDIEQGFGLTPCLYLALVIQFLI